MNAESNSEPPAPGAEEQREPVKQAVHVGNQLLVFHSEDRYGPYCTAAAGPARSRGRRCGTSILELGLHGWQEVSIQGADGFVTVPNTGRMDEQFWIRQRCPKHLEEGTAVVAPEWTFFDPERDADIVSRPWPVWTPQGVVGRRFSIYDLVHSGRLQELAGVAGSVPVPDPHRE